MSGYEWQHFLSEYFRAKPFKVTTLENMARALVTPAGIGIDPLDLKIGSGSRDISRGWKRQGSYRRK